MQDQLPHFFISRAGADAAFADKIGRILEDAGYRVVLQQWDFANRNFMERMDAALKSGARVIALLSNEYLASDHCTTEWFSVLARDPLNKNAHVIVLRIVECTPKGLLTALAYWDLVPVRGQDALVRDIVLAAVTPGRRKNVTDAAAQYWRTSRPIVHDSIKATANFTGREDELAKIKAALSFGATAAVHGLGGIGKSTIAREYAWREREAYAGVWWLNADRPRGAVGWEGVEKGLVELGDQFIRGLAQAQDRAAAARQALDFIAGAGFEKPWLLVYDNVDDRRVLSDWAPRSNAHVLATTRIGGWGAGVVPVEVKEWPLAEAVQYLIKESGRADLTEADATAVAEALGCLPLALSHAAAYLRARKTVSAEAYIADLARHMNEAPKDADYSRAVFATFRAALEQVEAEAPGAHALLSLAAFYAPDDIPVELFQQDPEHYPPALALVVADAGRLTDALGALDHLSLIDFRPQTRTFSVHRLAQAAARDALGDATVWWAAGAVAAANAASPYVEFANWPLCERLVAHARAVTSLAGDWVGAPLARLLNQTGSYLQERASYFEAELLYQRSLAIHEKALGPDNPLVARPVNNLALLYQVRGKHDQAEPLYLRSLQLREKAVGPDHPDVGQILNNLATLYDFQGKHDQAEPLYLRSLSIRERALGLEHLDVGQTLNNLAEVYRTQAKYDHAEPLYQRCISIFENALGPDHPKVTPPLNNLALLYHSQRKYGQAESLYQRCLAIREMALGPDHPELATPLNNLAELYRDQGKYDVAEPLFRRSLCLGENALGPDHPEIATTLGNLAQLLAQTGRLDEAAILARRSLQILQSGLGEAHPYALTASKILEAIEGARRGDSSTRSGGVAD